MTEENKLINSIMEYWETCAYRDMASDGAVNDLICNYALLVGINQEDIENRVDITVRNMTNSQKRKLLKMLIKSGIK